MTNKVWFQTAVGIICLLVIIFLFIKVKHIFHPLFVIIQTTAIPVGVGGILFYLTYPILQFFEKRKNSRWASITAIFVILIALGGIFYIVIGPVIADQTDRLVKNAPVIEKEISNTVNFIINQRDRLPDSANDAIESTLQNMRDYVMGLGPAFLNFVQSFFQGLFMLVLAPFFLFFMLKDHEKFLPFVTQFFKGETRKWIRQTLIDINQTLQDFIQGQLLVSFLVGVMLYIGYLIIGLNYALLLSIFGMLMNVIPFLGPYIAVIPAMIIGLIQEPQMALYVAIIMLVAQQIESGLISPNVMGKVLELHPLTVITVILAAGNIAGFLGILIAIPTYAVLKVIVRNLYQRRITIADTITDDIDE